MLQPLDVGILEKERQTISLNWLFNSSLLLKNRMQSLSNTPYKKKPCSYLSIQLQ